MRATISFDIDVDKVEETMKALIGQQSSSLRIAATILDNAHRSTLLEEVSEAIDVLGNATSQLQQYQQMLSSFKRARFETILPQPAKQTNMAEAVLQTKQAAANLTQFNSFLEKINTEVSDEGAKPEEG
jgi:glycyl-tRNA synthetase beta subunit